MSNNKNNSNRDEVNVNAFENQIPSTQTGAPEAGVPSQQPKRAPDADNMPASEAARKAEVKEDKAKSAQKPGAPAPQGGFVEKVWKPILWPILTLVVICMVTSLLLSLTFDQTDPIAQANADAANTAARQELLPEADGFEPVEIEELPEGIIAMYKATNDVGYVVEAYSQGYGGRVPAMVAFDSEGMIAGVRFLANSETPGLGQKLITDPAMAAQFEGLPSERVNELTDTITAATISSNAGRDAVNRAIEFYRSEVLGETTEELTPEGVRASLLPDATVISPIDIQMDGIQEAWVGDDGNYIVYGTAIGYYGTPVDLVVAAVALNPDGEITGLWLDTSLETDSLGGNLSSNTDFVGSFIGLDNVSDVEAVTGATISSNAVKEAVQKAIDALPNVMQAPVLEGSEAPSSEPDSSVPEEAEPASQEINAQLLPDATEFTPIEVGAENVTEAYHANNGNYIIYATAIGYYGTPIDTVTAAVAIDENGVILNLWLDTSHETKGVGRELSSNADFINSFLGQSNTEGIDVVAGSTFSSQAVIDAVQAALDALPLAKEAG